MTSIAKGGDIININELLKAKNITKYRLAKLSEVPYATLNDICNGKTNIAKCSAETVYRIAKALEVSVEELIEPYMEKRPAFELFKSHVCHRVKELGDIDFMVRTLESHEISILFEKQWYPESLYLLGMLDYLSRINDVPLCDEYDEIRKRRLTDIVYPSSVIAFVGSKNEKRVKEEAIRNAIPEFLRFNIVEGEIRDVI